MLFRCLRDSVSAGDSDSISVCVNESKQEVDQSSKVAPVLAEVTSLAYRLR